MPIPIILRLSGRHMNRRFLQSVLFVLGVALGVAVIIAIDVANGSAKRAFSLSAESVSGRATHQIVGGPGGLPSSLYTTLRVDLGIRDSAPVVEDYVLGAEVNNQPLRLLGVDPLAEPPFRDYLLTDTSDTLDFGTLVTFIAQPDTVLISQSLADRFAVGVGDTITLRVRARRIPVQVVGLLQTDNQMSEQALDDLILADIATVQEILDRPGVIDRIDLILPEEDTTRLQETISAMLPEGTRIVAADEDSNALAQMIDAFELNLQALSLLALVVGTFLIYNTVTFSVVQRRPVIGILRALGTTRQQIFWIILSEAIVLGVIGTISGLGLGVIFGRGAVGLVSQTISDLYFTVNVQNISIAPWVLAKGAVVGIGASMVTAIMPAFAATHTPPIGTMRRSDQERSIVQAIPWMVLAAVGLNLVGLVLLQIPTKNIEIGFAALFVIMIGGAFLTFPVLIIAMRLATPVAQFIFGIVGRMATRAVIRTLSRTSVAVAALTMSVSVIVGISVMIASFRNTVDDWLNNTLSSDIFITLPTLTSTQAQGDLDPEILDIVQDVAGIIEVSAARDAQVAAPDYPDLPLVNLQAVISEIATSRQFAWNDAPGGDYEAAMADGAVIVTESFAFRRGIDQENNTITVLTDRGEHTFTVVGVYYDYTTDQGRVRMDMETYQEFYDDTFYSSAVAYNDPDANLDDVIERIRVALADYDVQVQSNKELREGVFEIFDNTFAITIALRMLATLVAFVGILSALLALQLENTRQYGVMRAVGLTPGQLWRFTLIQTGLMGVVAGGLAIPIGLELALVLIDVINVRSFGWSMTLFFVPRELIESFMVAVVAAVTAGLYPAWQLSRLATAEVLRRE